ncbi:NifU family protein [Acetobacteraceae bacterium]|nr:NifU family protein [Acetobacteraceae bacterium]
MSDLQETMIPVLIDVQETPNPLVRKFALGRSVTGSFDTVELVDFAQSRKISDFGAELFEYPETKRVFLGRDFVSVMVQTETSWESFSPLVLSKISEYLSANKPFVKEGVSAESKEDEAEVSPEDRVVVQQIKDLIEDRVRPAVARDGGDIIFRSYHDGIVYLVLKGACAGCPSAQATLKNGVERLLKHFIPQVLEVRQAS